MQTLKAPKGMAQITCVETQRHYNVNEDGTVDVQDSDVGPAIAAGCTAIAVQEVQVDGDTVVTVQEDGEGAQPTGDMDTGDDAGATKTVSRRRR